MEALIQPVKAFEFQTRWQGIYALGDHHMPAFLYCSGPVLLFDPGPSAFGPHYLQRIRDHRGCLPPLMIVLTHSHFDHCGAVPYIQRNASVSGVAASLNAADVLQRPNAVALIRRLNADYETKHKRELAGEDVSFDGIRVDRVLRDGDSIELEDGTACLAVGAPGHTRDCLGYFLPGSGVLFAGDSAGVFANATIHSPFLASFEDYAASLDRFESLQPDVLCVAHDGILVGPEVRRFFKDSRRAAMAFRDVVAKHLLYYDGDQEKVVCRIMAEEYDARFEKLQNRAPYLLSLQAKVNAVAQLQGLQGGAADGRSGMR